ncbi:pyrroline-5-carboxylate reductase [Cytobacillus sp. NCCP-133]|uniref:pyrroline-5-carboxylate reductase n=1 Tax=Cytobacillus sp. NCCP-133 TaxID=766848 RepID=UPI00222E0A34|nr:pyrroline-5-carboxylate reductase [Cytobacillus sp. NCCP-133]GLB58098.1 pyrroline-5-carboxylate reductase 2 [Cytobacillus sp. NCCP-133]
MKKLAVVGAGSMAEALISGIIESQLITGENIWVTNKCNKEKLQSIKKAYGVQATYDLSELFKGAEAVILAMKPKDAADAITLIKPYLKTEMLVISVLAGISIESIELLSERKLSVVRTMPNTSAAVGKSASALSVNERVTKQQMKLVKDMFETVGIAAFVEEAQLDAVTGLSGSGSAYIYYLAEAMEKSAQEIGLEKEMAKDFIIQTLIGAAEMLAKSAKEPQQLRKEVTSPGGTTEAGVRVLEENGVQKAFIECIKEATAKSKCLGHSFTSKVKIQQHS